MTLFVLDKASALRNDKNNQWICLKKNIFFYQFTEANKLPLK